MQLLPSFALRRLRAHEDDPAREGVNDETNEQRTNHHESDKIKVPWQVSSCVVSSIAQTTYHCCKTHHSCEINASQTPQLTYRPKRHQLYHVFSFCFWQSSSHSGAVDDSPLSRTSSKSTASERTTSLAIQCLICRKCIAAPERRI